MNQISLIATLQDEGDVRVSYYAILGAVYSIFQQDIQKSLIKISHYPTPHKTLRINLTFIDELVTKKVLQDLFSRDDIQFQLNGRSYKLDHVDFSVKTLFFSSSKDIRKSYICRFLSPTYVRRNQINVLFPMPEVFLWNVWKKIKPRYSKIIDEKVLKELLQYQIVVGEYNLKTKVVEIKGGKKAGVVGYVKYYPKNIPEAYQQTIIHLFEAIPFVGIGSGTRLGLGNVNVGVTG